MPPWSGDAQKPAGALKLLAPREQLQRLVTNLAIKIRIGIVHKAAEDLGFFCVTYPNPVLTSL